MNERLDQSPWADARWLVVAPHPDDETIGAGALIGQAARDGRLGGIVYLTDGTGSHPAGTSHLAVVRRREAVRALQKLGAGECRINWMGWRDAHPHAAGSPRFERDAMRLGDILRRRQIDAVAVSDIAERHCDHVAAYHLARRASRLSRRRVSLFCYHVWGVAPDRSCRRFGTGRIAPGLRRRALQMHRSQTSPIFGEGFRLPANLCRMPTTDCLTLRRLTK